MNIDYKKYFVSVEIIRVYIVIAVVFFSITLAIQQLRTALREFNPSQTTKIYLKGFINNPRSLILSARMHLENGKYDQALIDLELAKGLYEINKLNYDVIQEEIVKLKQIIKKND